MLSSGKYERRNCMHSHSFCLHERYYHRKKVFKCPHIPHDKKEMKGLDQTCMCGPMYPFLCAVLSSTYCNLQKLWSSEIKRISRGGVPLKFCFTFEILYSCQTSDMNLARSIMDPVIERQACNDI